MKKYLFIVVCCVGMACATDYNPLTDWVIYPNSSAVWSFGGRVEDGGALTANFGDLIPAVHLQSIWGPIPDSEGWTVSGTFDTCTIWWKDPWLGKPGPIMNSWTNYQATVRLTPEAGIYDITGSFEGTGYMNPPAQTTYVYVIKNGDEILWQGGPITDYVTPAAFALTDVSLLAGDYIDFISANAGPSESRTSLVADIIAQVNTIAWAPSPGDGTGPIATDTDLCWYGPSDDPNNNTFNYNVYYGSAMDLENLSGPFAVSGSGGNPHCYTPAVELDNETEYAWRVDVVDPNNPAVIRTGDVWTFTTEPAYVPATLVSPTPSGVTGVAYEATLEWANDVDAEWSDVYFDTDETLVTNRDGSVQVEDMTVATSHDPYGAGLMDPNTVYYWVVDQGVGSEVVASGTVWNFTTKLVECVGEVSELDTNGDCAIDLIDFAALANLWLQCGYDNPVACPF